jgi:excisionase family DNA binding protein
LFQHGFAREAKDAMNQQITAPEAARQAGVMLPYLYALLAVGRLRGEKVDGKWQIAREDFDAWRKTRRQNQKGCEAPAEALREARA